MTDTTNQPSKYLRRPLRSEAEARAAIEAEALQQPHPVADWCAGQQPPPHLTSGFIIVHRDRYLDGDLRIGSGVHATREKAVADADLLRKLPRFDIFIAKVEIERAPLIKQGYARVPQDSDHKAGIHDDDATLEAIASAEGR